MNSGKAIRQKIRDAIKAKLVDLGSYVDDELPDYIMVMLANKRSEAQMTQDLDLFLNNNANIFTSWLFELLKKLEPKPGKSERKKKKKEKSLKHKSQMSEESSSHQQQQQQPEPPEPATAQTSETVSIAPQVQPLQQVTIDLSVESAAPVISILSDTHDVLDEELTKEIDADRRKSIALAEITHPAPSQVTKRGEASSRSLSYRQHVTQQRASKSNSELLKELEEELHGMTSTRVVESTTPQKSMTDVKLRLGERHVQEVIVSDVHRKRQGLGSVIAQVIHHDVEEDSDDEDLSVAKKVASSVRANRRPTLPKSRQANTSLLKRAVSEATASTSSGTEKQVVSCLPISRPPHSKLNRIQLQTIKPAIVREITQRVATSSDSTSSSDQGIRSRSMQRERLERDFDSQTFQTIEHQAEDELEEGDVEAGYTEEEPVEVAPGVRQKGVYVYKNVVAVVGSSSRSLGETQVEPVTEEDEEVLEESFPVVSQQEADSRQIYVAENVSIADSTQSPENPLPEETEEIIYEEEGEDGDQIRLPEEGYIMEEQEQNVPEKRITHGVTTNPRFIVTLEGANKRPNFSAKQRRKIQRKTVKRGFVQTSNMPDVVITKQPRKSLSPEVKRQFIFTETRAPETVVPVVMPMVEEEEEEEDEELSMVADIEPFMVYSAIPEVEPLTISMQDSDEDEGFEAEEPPQEQGTNKSSERCKFWPACKNGDSCTFIHPTTPCRTFPNCKFGDKCLYIHPNCKFDSLCTKPSCPYTHATRKSVPPVVLHVGKPMMNHPPPRQGIQTACKFHPGCQNPQCPFLHPKMCRFGKACSRQGCTFYHANVAVRSSLTWTKQAKHISQRPFAALTSTPAPVSLPAKPLLTSNPRFAPQPK